MCDQSNKFVNNLSGIDSVDVLRWRPLRPYQMLRLFISGGIKLNIKCLLTLGIIWRTIKCVINPTSLSTIPNQLSWSWDRETIVILNPVVVVKVDWAWPQIDLVSNRKNNKMCDQSNKFVNNVSGLDSVEAERWRPLWPFQILSLFISRGKLKIKCLLTLGNIWRRIKIVNNPESTQLKLR
jgi:hypothetical protein